MYAWTFQIFLNTADRELLFRMFPLSPTVIPIIVIMILRVYAMWNRSKKILYLLLFIYVPQVIISVVFAGVYNTTAYLSSMSRTPCVAAISLKFPASLLPSYNCPNHGFLFLQSLVEQHTIRY